MKSLAKLLVTTVAVVAVLGIAFLIGMRMKSPLVIDTVRKLNRRYMNPKQMETAGTPGAYASIIRHTGRKSGTSYETPVGVATTERGFVINLPYGRSADWLKNVMAAGSAMLVHDGREIAVDHPEIVPFDEVAPDLSDAEVTTAKVFGIDECLRLQPALAT